MNGAGVQVDAVAAMAHDLVDEKVRDPGCQGSLGGPRKAAVEITAVRQVAGLVDKAVDVDDRHRHQGTGEPAQGLDLK